MVTVVLAVLLVQTVAGLRISGRINVPPRRASSLVLRDARLAIDLETLSRSELQSLAKAFGVKANGKTADIVQQLTEIRKASASKATASAPKAAAPAPSTPRTSA